MKPNLWVCGADYEQLAAGRGVCQKCQYHWGVSRKHVEKQEKTRYVKESLCGRTELRVYPMSHRIIVDTPCSAAIFLPLIKKETK